jgi:hypothetical protein
MREEFFILFFIEKSLGELGWETCPNRNIFIGNIFLAVTAGRYNS